MNRKEYIAGLDIGTTKTCCVLADVDLASSAIEILGAGLAPSEGVRKGVVVDLDSTTQSIRAAVDDAQKQAGNIQIRTVVVGVTGEHVSSLNSRGVIAIASEDNEISSLDVERVVEASRVIVLPPEREIIHSIPRGFIVDGQDGIKDPVGMFGGRLEVETHIVTGSTAFLDNVVKCVQQADLAIDREVLEQIATSIATVQDAERDLGVALIDIGGGTTNVALFIDGVILYTAALPIGGSHVTKDIAVGLRSSAEEAERVKIEYGCASMDMVGEDELFQVSRLSADEPSELPRSLLASIIEPRMEEIFEKIREELIKSGYQGMLPGGAVITGGGAILPGVVDMAEKLLSMPVRLGLPRGVGGQIDSVNTPIHTTAVGLAMYAAKQHLDLRSKQKTAKLKGGLRGLFKLFTRRDQ